MLFAALAVRGALGYLEAMDMLGVNLAVPAGGVKVSDLAEKAAWLGVVRVKLFDFDKKKVVQLRKAYSAAGKRLSIAVALPLWMHTDKDMKDMLEVVKGNLDIVQTVFVLNEPCLHGYCKGEKGEDYLRQLKHITQELTPHKVEVTTPFSMGGIMKNTYPPQNSEFIDPDFMRRVVEILAIGDNTLYANLYPYLDIACNNLVPLNYALGEPPQSSVDGTVFTSQIDGDVKSLRYAIKKLDGDFSNVKVGIGETGWAHSGGEKPKNKTRMRIWDLSTTHYSNKFYANIATSLAHDQWTEQNLGRIYIFDLADEPLKTGHYPAYDGEKFFGIGGLWTKEDKKHIAPWKWDAVPQPEALPEAAALDAPVNAVCAKAVKWCFNKGKFAANAGLLYGAPMGQISSVDFAKATLDDWHRLFFCAGTVNTNDWSMNLSKKCGTPPSTCTKPPCGFCGPAPGQKPAPQKTVPVVPKMRPQDLADWKIIQAQEATMDAEAGSGKAQEAKRTAGSHKHRKPKAQQKWEEEDIQAAPHPFWGSYAAAAGLVAVATAVAVAGLVARMRRPVGHLQTALHQESELETGDPE